MKKLLNVVLAMGVAAVFFLTVLGSGSSLVPFGEVAIAEAGPNVTIAPAPVKPKKGKLLIAGSGFKPKQELGIRLVMGGVLSDISYMVKPLPVANEYGAFASTWKIKGRYFKLLKAGTAYTVWIVDQDGNTLATAPLVIDKGKKKKKKKKM